MDKVYAVYGHYDCEQWHEKTFGNKQAALAHGKQLAKEFFKDRNHQNEPDLKLFGPDKMDGAIAHWSYGYAPENPEPLISVFEHQVH